MLLLRSARWSWVSGVAAVWVGTLEGEKPRKPQAAGGYLRGTGPDHHRTLYLVSR